MTEFGRCPLCGATNTPGTTGNEDGFYTCGACRQRSQASAWATAPAAPPEETKEEKQAKTIVELAHKLEAAKTRNIELQAEVDALKAVITDLQRYAV